MRNGLKYAYETADKEMKAFDHIGATLTLEYGLLNFFYTNHVEDTIVEILTKAMEDASGKPMVQASEILFAGVHKIMTTDNFITPTITNQQTEQGNTKGFFSRLFGF